MSHSRTALLLLALIWTVCAQQQRQQIGAGAVAGLIVLGVALLAGLICLDRRRGYPVIGCLRGKIGQLWLCIVRAKRGQHQKSEMLETDEAPQSAKRNLGVFQAEKITHEAESNEAMQEVLPAGRSDAVQMMELEQDAPPVNLKEVFEKKESKTKNKISKKSKSKIRNRLQGKASEEEPDREADDLSQDNSLNDDNDNSLPGENALQTSASDS